MLDACAASLTRNIVAGCVLVGCIFFLPNVVQSATSNSATLQWAANLEPDLAGYRIYHGTRSGVYGFSQTVGKTTTYQYTNLESDKTYFFTITAFDESGNESLPSPEVSKTIVASNSQTAPSTSTTSNSQTVTNTSTATNTVTGGGTTLPLPRSGWAVWVDSEETAVENGRGINVKDGLSSTIWHTGWSGGNAPAPPHSLVVDLGAVAILEGFRALPRQNTGTNGQIGNYEFYVKTNSETPPTTPPVLGEWTRVSSGTFSNTKSEQQVLFGAVPSRYVWLRALSEAQGMNNPWTSLAEFNVLGTLLDPLPQEITPPATTANNSSLSSAASTSSTGPSTSTTSNSQTTPSTSTAGNSQPAPSTPTASNGQTESSTHTANSNPTPSTNVLWRNTSTGEVAVWNMNGLTITSVGFPGSTSTDWKIEQVGDMNGDGEGDILWRNTISGVVAIWLMNEGTMISSGFLGGVTPEWVIKGIGDVNGDSKADVLWRNSSNGMVAVWLMNGLTLTSVGFLGSTPMAWEIEQVGDVNNDGKADLVWQNQTSGTVAVWLMNGLTLTSVGFPASTSTDWQIQSVGDMNGDGKFDLLWRNTNSGMVAVWLMNGTTMASYGFLGGVPSEWEIKQMSDMNDDGKADVVLQNQTSGMVAVWLMNGLSINSVGFPGSTPANWKIQR